MSHYMRPSHQGTHPTGDAPNLLTTTPSLTTLEEGEREDASTVPSSTSLSPDLLETPASSEENAPTIVIDHISAADEQRQGAPPKTESSGRTVVSASSATEANCLTPVHSFLVEDCQGNYVTPPNSGHWVPQPQQQQRDATGPPLKKKAMALPSNLSGNSLGRRFSSSVPPNGSWAVAHSPTDSTGSEEDVGAAYAYCDDNTEHSTSCCSIPYMRKHPWLVMQMTLNVCVNILQFLEVLNVYNCKHWMCGGVPGFLFCFSFINFLFLCHEKPVMIPTIMTHLFGFLGAIFWDFERWNVDTRHRTEYYDTHDLYAGNLWLLNFWNFVYLCYLKPSFAAAGAYRRHHHYHLQHLQAEGGDP